MLDVEKDDMARPTPTSPGELFGCLPLLTTAMS
jgi:hypothetical protein